MTKYNELTLIAGFCNITAFSLLVYQVHITKITNHLTYMWIFLFLISQLLLFIYGQINHIFGIYIPALIMFSGLLYIFYIKTVYTENYLIEKELKEKDILKD
jgi:small neutral amino acid transporter SnatA (MarC family)